MCKECWVGQHPILWRRGDEACSEIYVRTRVRNEEVKQWEGEEQRRLLERYSERSLKTSSLHVLLVTVYFSWFIQRQGFKAKIHH